MFTCGMRETTDKSVVLHDVSPEAFKLLLQYIYTRQLQLNAIAEDMMMELLGIAHKFQMPSLEVAVAAYIKNTLTMETFLKVFDVAFLYEMPELKEAFLEFVRKNGCSILESDLLLRAPEVKSA